MAELTMRRRVGVVRGGDLVIRRVEGSNMTVVTRYGILARVVEADIRCTNGYIHLIDRVIVRVRKDVSEALCSDDNVILATVHDAGICFADQPRVPDCAAAGYPRAVPHQDCPLHQTCYLEIS